METDRRTLGGHENDFFVESNIRLVSKQTRDHEFGTVANSVDGAILDYDSLVANEERFQRSDDSAEVRF
jgi:hypothetical protein